MYPAGDGNFWVSDTGGGRVIKVSATGDQISVLGERGSEPGKFIEPTSLYQAPSGVLYVADVGNSRVQTFSPDGSPLAQWSMGVSDSRDGNRLTADGENVLVTQGESRSIVRYDAQGKELGRWSYARNNEIATPASIAPLPDGRYAVLFFRQDYGVVFKP
jgi:DNA-binding beta-propeller fold protein YncE